MKDRGQLEHPPPPQMESQAMWECLRVHVGMPTGTPQLSFLLVVEYLDGNALLVIGAREHISAGGQLVSHLDLRWTG